MNCPKCNYSGELFTDDWGNKRCPECKTLIEGAPRRPVEKKEEEVSDLPENGVIQPAFESAATYYAEAKRRLYGGTTPTERFEPWLTIWYRPRATMRSILNTSPGYWVIEIPAIMGFLSAFSHLNSIFGFIFAAIKGVVFYIVGLYIWGAILTWTGRWLGGKAPAKYVRSAIAWGYVPFIGLVLFGVVVSGIIGADLTGNNVFDPTAGSIQDFAAAAFFSGSFVFLIILGAILWLYGLIISLSCLAEAQEFSFLHALGNSIIGWIVLSAIFILPFIIFAVMLKSCLGS